MDAHGAFKEGDVDDDEREIDRKGECTFPLSIEGKGKGFLLLETIGAAGAGKAALLTHEAEHFIMCFKITFS